MTVEAAAAVRLRAQLVRSSSAAVPLRSLCDTATGRGDSNTRHRTYIAINMRINVYIASCIIDTGQKLAERRPATGGTVRSRHLALSVRLGWRLDSRVESRRRRTPNT